MEDIYDVYFVGQDYQPIINAAKSMKMMKDGKEYFIDGNADISSKEGSNSNNESDEGRSWEILDCFLNEVAPNGKCYNSGLIVNGNQKKLYDINFGQEGDKGYFCGLVGVIRKPVSMQFMNDDGTEISVKFNVTLQIKSRLDVKDSQNGQHEISKPFFLSTMLLRDKVKLSNNTVPSSEDEIYDYLLLFWFIEQLERACLKGYYKTYRRFEKNDDRVKGTLDIARHIRLNAGQNNGRIAYTYRENTINNYLNQLIVAAYYHLKNKYPDLVEENFDNNNDLKRVINYLANETDYSNTNIKNILKNNLKAISHPYFTEYEELRLTCLRILRDEGISIFDGESDDSTQGILFYLPELWEKFLKDKLLEAALPKSIYMKPQFKIMNFDGKETTFPDYVFFLDKDHKKPFMILDAKCKPKWENAAEGGSLTDVMEDYNKCLRDMVAANSHATGVIFPTNNQNASNWIFRHRISKYNKVDRFYTIPVSVPYVEDDETYSDWKNKFEKNIGEKRDKVREIIKAEADFTQKIAELVKDMENKR